MASPGKARLKKIPNCFPRHRVSLAKTHQNVYLMNSEGQVEYLTSGQGQAMTRGIGLAYHQMS